jgi:two-component system chemotaxis sensor kinase CheA
METESKLKEFVEQAACCANLLSPTELTDVQSLQDVLGKIREAVGGLDRGPVDLRRQIEGTTAETVDVLQHLIQNDLQDTAKAMSTICQAICTLQSLIGQLAEPPTQVSAAPAPAPSAPGALTLSAEDAPLVLDFVTESREHIENAEAALLELENHPQEAELINKIFRAFHTIKGMAGFLNLAEIQSLAHSSEGLLDRVRKGQLALGREATDVVLEAIDGLKKMLAGLKNAVESGQPVSPQEFLPALIERLKAATEGRTSCSQAEVREADRKLDKILEDQPGSQKKTASAVGTTAAEDKVKVSTTRLDNLINLAGELVTAQLMVAEEVNRGQSREHGLIQRVAHQGKIVRELQELSMSMRMVPVQGVFQKMVRLARDLSHKAGKAVDFVTAGEETELDRTMVDQISDPLVHMVRNAIDHGIEPSEVRTSAGKKATGRVELRAFHQAGSIVIEMQDDGKGLDKDRILKKAVEQGQVQPGQELSEEEIFKLIFLPGLSTADKVTSVSGRGVGMDVVKKNIEALRGRIEIRSTPGRGTTFTIRLPLTLAVIDGQIVRVGDSRYIIPTSSIIRSLRPASQQISTVQNRGEMILERGELISLVRLHNLFGVVPSTEDPTKALIVVVEADGRRCCLLVDDLLGQQQVVIKSLGEALGQVRGVSGGAIMGDGKVTDMAGLMLQEAVLSEREFRQISDLVYQHCGINLHDGKRELVRARLAKRLREGRFQTFAEYIRHVLDDPTGDELTALVDTLSTNLTKFFREDLHFEYLRSRWLPPWLESKQARHDLRLRAWSAGCSSGEEPYSIAITLLEAVQGRGRWDVKVLATDVSTRMLARAKRGCYDRERAEPIPPALRSKYLIRTREEGIDRYEVAPSLRSVVILRYLNLVQDWPIHGPLDLIFCRNVMIYFDKPTQNRLISRFYDLLAPGGMLFTGHSESLTGIEHKFKYVQPTIYCKP